MMKKVFVHTDIPRRGIRAYPFRLAIWFGLLSLICGCAVSPLKPFAASQEATLEDFKAIEGESQGVVLLAVNWTPINNCAGYQSAALDRLHFDKAETPLRVDLESASLVLNDPGPEQARPNFDHYAYILPAGTYGISGVSLESILPSGELKYLAAERADLIQDNQFIGGTFTVNPGETVYIGNFYLNCVVAPTLWRYYAERGDDLDDRITGFSKKYPFLDYSNVVYRLFDTQMFGNQLSGASAL